MKVHKFDTIYPRTLWIVNVSDEDPLNLLKKFFFIKNTSFWNIFISGINKAERRIG